MVKKFISWNVNGINATVEKGLIDFMNDQNADYYCFQETKTEPRKAKEAILDINNYYDFWVSSKEKKGYSGVVTYSKKEPISVIKGIGVDKFDKEGRVLTLELDDFYLINVYFVNSGPELERLEDKRWFNNEFQYFCEDLRKDKPLIIGGDFNVAHKEKDLARPEQKQMTAGFTFEERDWFDQFLNKGFIDTFREFNDQDGKYTYWTYQYNAREKNNGWRIDYWLINEELKDKLENSYHLDEIKGSDHCPIVLKMDL